MRKGIALESTVFIVDDRGGDGEFDEAVHTLRAASFVVQILSSPSLAVELSSRCRSACVVSDLHGRGFDPLQLPGALVKAGCTARVVFVADLMDTRVSVLAMKSGAMDVLVKPIDPAELLSAIRGAMAQDLAARLARAWGDERRQRFELLTPREHEVCGWVSDGLLNKQIAARLGIAEKTVKHHRGQAMRKLGVRSVPELVRIVDVLLPLRADTRVASQSPAQWAPSISATRSMRYGETAPLRDQISNRDRTRSQPDSQRQSL